MQTSPQFSNSKTSITSSTSNVQSSAAQQAGNGIVSGLKDSQGLATPGADVRRTSLNYSYNPRQMGLNYRLINYGRTALMDAANDGDAAAVQRLLNSGANCQASTADGWTALMLAASEGHTAVVQLLLKAGANFEDRNAYGSMPLMSAASKGHIDTIQLLVTAGAPVRFGGDEALRVAAKKGRADVVELLIDKGVVVTGKAAAGESALRVAVEHGHADVVQLLIDKGVDLSVAGKTLLAKAAELGHVRIVQLLIQAKVDVKNTEVATALLEIGKHGYTEVLQVLIDAGFDVKNSYGFSGPALMSAATNGHTQTVSLFIKHGVITAQALPAAAEKGHLDVVQALLEESLVKENQPAIKAALQAAKKKGHIAIVELIEGIVGSSSSAPAEPSWASDDIQWSEQAFKAAEAGDVQRVFDCLWKISDQRRGDAEEQCKVIWQKNRQLSYVKQLVRLMAEAERKQRPVEPDGEWMDALPEWNEDCESAFVRIVQTLKAPEKTALAGQLGSEPIHSLSPSQLPAY